MCLKRIMSNVKICNVIQVYIVDYQHEDFIQEEIKVSTYL